MKQSKNCRYGNTCRKQESCHYQHYIHLTKDRQEKAYKHQQSKQRGHYRQRRKEKSRSESRKKEREERRQDKDRRRQHQHRNSEEKQHRRERSPQIEYKNVITYRKKFEYKHQQKYQQKYEPKYQPKTQPKQDNKYENKYQNKCQNKSQPKYQQKNVEKYQPKTENKNHQKIQNTPNRTSTSNTITKLEHQRKLSKFCAIFHLQGKCGYKKTCDKLHAFIFKEYNLVTRQVVHANAEFTTPTKICHSVRSQSVEYMIKTQNQLKFYDYKPTKSELTELASQQLIQSTSAKNEYFGCEGSYLYFSFLNQPLNFYNIVCYDLTNSKLYQIKDAHSSQITGMAQLRENKFMTVSLDGTIKVWDLNEQTLTISLDKQSYHQFEALYKPGKKGGQLYFIQKIPLATKQLIFIGSCESKLLVFGNQTPLSFREIRVSQSQLNIVRVRKIQKRAEKFELLVLARSQAKSFIFKLTIHEEQQLTEKLIQIDNQQDKCISTFELFNSLLIISYGSQIVFYNLDNPRQILGGIMHNNHVSDIVISKYQLQQTGVDFNIMAVVESPNIENSGAKKGTLSIYYIHE